MDQITKLYMNRCQVLQEQISVLEHKLSLLNEAGSAQTPPPIDINDYDLIRMDDPNDPSIIWRQGKNKKNRSSKNFSCNPR